MNTFVKRYELKYFISKKEYYLLKYRLKHLLKRDSYSTDENGYFIRSLYFDSHDDECLYEKLSGTHTRKKYRIRIYSTDDTKAKFEIKHKQNNQVFKQSATISKESVYRIIDGDYEELLKYNNPILNDIYIVFKTRYYKPKVVVDYIRDAYVYDFLNLRITFDKQLSSNTTNFDIFSKDLHTIPVLLDNKDILEIKYNHTIPEHIWQILQVGSFERMAISKYTLSRKYLKLNKWEDN